MIRFSVVKMETLFLFESIWNGYSKLSIKSLNVQYLCAHKSDKNQVRFINVLMYLYVTVFETVKEIFDPQTLMSKFG